MHPRPTNGINTDYPVRTGNAIDAIDRRLKGNLIDNGAFQIWQRGNTFASGAAQYAADRWGFSRAGAAAGATFSRQVGSNAQYCARVQRDNANASTAVIAITHSIESANSIPYRSRPLSLQFRARKGANFSAAGDLLGYLIVSGTGTDESMLAGYTGAVNMANSTVVLTAAWQTFTIPVVTPGAAITQLGLQVQYTPVGVAGAADYFEIEEVPLVFGDYAGEFPYKTLAEEYVNCRRYARVEDFRIPAATAVSERINMRAVPTITGGGAGYTSTGTTKDALVHFQTGAAVATLTLSADI